jgi:hypothetical protein
VLVDGSWVGALVEIGGAGAGPPPAADCSRRSSKCCSSLTWRGVATGMELGREDAGVVAGGFVLRLGGGANVALMSGGDGSWY